MRRATSFFNRHIATILGVAFVSVILPLCAHFAYNWWYSPRVAFHDATHATRFFDRVQETAVIEKMVNNPHLFVVLGPHDAGKTFLLNHVLATFRDKGNRVRILDMRKTEFNRLDGERASGQSMNSAAVQAALRDGISRAVQEMQRGVGGCVLFIDEANLLPEDFPYHELIDITKQQKKCAVILASSTSAFQKTISRVFNERFEFLYVGDLTKELAADFWTAHLGMNESLFAEVFSVFGGRMYDIERVAVQMADGAKLSETNLFWNFKQLLSSIVRSGAGKSYTCQQASAFLNILVEQETRGVAAVPRTVLDTALGSAAVDALIDERLIIIRGERFGFDITASPPFRPEEFPLAMVARPAFVYHWKHFPYQCGRHGEGT